MGTDRTPLSTPASSAAPSSGLKGGRAVPPPGGSAGPSAGTTTTTSSPPAAATMNNNGGGGGAAAPMAYAWGKVGAAATSAPPTNGGGSTPPPAYASPDTIASAVHLAREDDAEKLAAIRNEPRSHSNNSTDSTQAANFYHYAVPRQWMAQVLRYLNSSEDGGGGGSSGSSSGGDGTSMMGGRPGRILNRELLAGEGAEESREERKARWAAKAAGAGAGAGGAGGTPVASYAAAAAPPKSRLLTAFANYEVDYHLVGPALWDLLSTKFGHDVAIPFPLRVQRGWGANTLSVVVRNELFDDGKDDGDDLYGGIINTAAGGGKQDSSKPKYKSTIVDGVKETLIPVPDSGKWNYGGMDDRVMKKARDREASAPTSPIGGDGDAKVNGANPADEDAADMLTDSEATVADGNAIIPLGPSTTSIAAAAAEAARQRNGGAEVANPIQVVEHETNGGVKDVSMLEAATDAAASAPVVATATKKRRHTTGLGNLGNTCFMNSTLQCLAHTAPLRQYFVYGNYQAELNRDNPLGTGGNLTTEFAKLLKEMWGVSGAADSASSSNGSGTGGLYTGGSHYFSSSYNNSAVYPRQFKTTLGEHASQFVGYDQHDSHELAAYLLDALHEDTNLVLKKPYVEKPEKKDDETDDQAAQRAWEAHLQRENSHMVEIFVGLFKTRVECPHSHCGRVSTTFDPCMYLPVPIPGATDRTLKLTFVPVDPNKRRLELQVTVSRTANIEGLRAKIVETVNKTMAKNGDSSYGTIHDDDICLVDMFKNKLWRWYHDLNECVDCIRESDVTFAFELRPVAEIHEETSAVLEAAMEASDDEAEDVALPPEATARKVKGDKFQRYDIDSDASIMDKFNANENAWVDILLNSYVKNSFSYHRWFSGREEPPLDKILPLYELMVKTIKKLERCSDSVVKVGPSASTTPIAMDEDPVDSIPSAANSEIREVSDADFDNALEHGDDDDISINEDGQTLSDRLDMDISSKFEKIRTAQDFAIFVRCAQKLREYIIGQQEKEKEIARQEKEKDKDGIALQVQLLRQGQGSFAGDPFTTPLVLRISPVLTVSGLREVIAEHLSRSLKLDESSMNEAKNDDAKPAAVEGEVKTEEQAPPKSAKITPLDILHQIPLTHGKGGKGSSGHTSTSSYRKLGALMRQQSGHISTEANVSTSPSDPDEGEIVADVVSDKDIVYLHWPSGLSEKYFNCEEWEKTDDMSEAGSPKKKADAVTLVDCIAKHCEKEQLEESEAWYCDRCKEHVRGFKEEHIYKAPPILIVNLKRFIYSPTTHRRNKIDTFIDFPLKGLDLSEFVMSWKEGEKPIYDLYAVSNHFGGLGGGHYTAYAKDDDGKWCNFDDSRVTEDVSESDIVSAAAYCLYYKRRDVPEVDTSAEVTAEADGAATTTGGETATGGQTAAGINIATPFKPSFQIIPNPQMEMDRASVSSNHSASSNVAMASTGSPCPPLADPDDMADDIDHLFDDEAFPQHGQEDQQDQADLDEANAWSLSNSHFGALQ